MSAVQQIEFSDDYASLVARLRNGEEVECVIDAGIWKGRAVASYAKKWYGDLFDLTMTKDADVIKILSESEFIWFCRKNGVVFESLL